MVGWWTVRNQAVAEANSQWGSDPNSPARSEYLRAQWYRARRYLIAGSVLVSVGVATAATGTVFILIHRRGMRDRALSLSPTLSPEGAGVQLLGRF